MGTQRILSTLCVLATGILGAPAALLAQNAPLAFTGARIIDGTGAAPIENGVLLVRDGRIAAVGPASEVTIPAGAMRTDLAGKTITPGFINAHGHAGENTRDKLGRYARYGITTVVSLGGEDASAVELRESQDTSALNRARLYLAGPVLDPDSPAQAQEQVAGVADMGADWVKIRVNEGSMSPQVYGAVIDTAHEHDLPLAAHMITLADTKGLLRAGADLLAHSIRDTAADQEVIDLMLDNEVCLSPTLTREVSTYAYANTPEFFADPFFRREVDQAVMDSLLEPASQSQAAAAEEQGRAWLAQAQENLKILYDAGVGIAFGTDSGAFTGRFPGYFEHMEMALMAEAGLTPMQILVSATGMAAGCMGLDDSLGTLEAGKWADFNVLGEDPLRDIANTKSLESVWIAGNRVPARAEGVQ